MAGKRSNIVCSRCKEVGGFVYKRWVKRTVNIPKANKVTNISEAWDYAAKVCLRMRENMILLHHPSPPDDKFNVYDLFSKFIPHTDHEIKAFELRHLSTPAKNIKTKKEQLTSQIKKTTEGNEDDHKVNKLPETNTIHIKLPKDAGRITKSSVSFLYGAIICLILRDISHNFPFPEETNKEFAFAIYTVFSIMEIDLRRPRIWPEWFDIFLDAHNHGYNAAASMNPAKTMICKKCSNIKKRILISMEILEETANELKCPQCGSRESINRSLTTKHLRNIQNKVLQRAADLSDYFPLFKKIENIYTNIIKNNTEAKEDFLRRFEEYEIQASKDLLSKRDYYFIGHYDRSKKCKRRWCAITNNLQLANIEIKDARYFSQYKPVINRFVNAKPGKQLEVLQKSAAVILKELGWPERFIGDKIYADSKKFQTLGSQN
jgi:hypothetical protein